MHKNSFNIKIEQKEKELRSEDYGADKKIVKNEPNAIYIFLQIRL